MKLLHLLKTTLFILTISLLQSCNQITLDKQEAQTLIVKTLNLPQKFHEEANANSNDPWGAGGRFYTLEKAGFVAKNGNWIYGYKIYATEKGKPYVIGEGKDNTGNKTLKFKGFDIVFNEINGIAINKEQHTATIRFSLKADNISPIMRVLEKDIDGIKMGELVFRKFDTGWQLESNLNKSSVEMVMEIWKGKRR